MIQLEDLLSQQANINKIRCDHGNQTARPIMPQCENGVYLRKNAVFLGTNTMERRVVDSWVIQALGKPLSVGCEYCDQGNGIYRHCCTLQGLFGGVCGNCMRAGRGGQCGLSLTTQELDEKRVEQDQAKFELQTSREERAANRRKTKDSEVDGAD
jgi:hypothetical protein